MAFLGWFDSELRPDGWFDTELQPRGWFDGEIVATGEGAVAYSYTASGGIMVSGQCISQRIAATEAATGGGYFVPKRKPVALPREFGYTASGGAQVGGAAAVEFDPVPVRIYGFTPRGGAQISGVAGIAHHDQIAAVIAADDEWLLLAA